MSAIDDAARLLAAADPLLLMSDFDGTLAPIAAHPDLAIADPQATGALRDLASLPRTMVAVISGRGRDDLRRLLAEVPGLVLIGGHGAERGAPVSIGDDQRATLDAVVAALEALAAGAVGAFVETKATSAALHVRGTSDADGQRLSAAALRGPGRLPGVRSIEGKGIVELTVSDADKGSAVQAMRADHPGGIAVFIGDDVTDEAGFAALRPPDFGIKVGDGDTAAPLRLPDQASVGPFLEEIAGLRAPASY